MDRDPISIHDISNLTTHDATYLEPILRTYATTATRIREEMDEMDTNEITTELPVVQRRCCCIELICIIWEKIREFIINIFN